MPELPDVETFKRYLDATSLHQRIVQIEVRARRILEETTVRNLKEGRERRTFESVQRHGRYLFVRLDSGRWLVLHFGMTGSLKYFRDMDKDPPYDRVLFSFENGYHLAYASQRKLGEVELIGDKERFLEEKALGPDALDPDFELAAFEEAFAESRAMAKSGLMNQQLVARIGNVYADEILFQAGIHPQTRLNELDKDALAKLFRTIKSVLQAAVERQAVPAQLPEDYIIPHRHEGGVCPTCGEALEQVQVSGRTAYFRPNRQGHEP